MRQSTAECPIIRCGSNTIGWVELRGADMWWWRGHFVFGPDYSKHPVLESQRSISGEIVGCCDDAELERLEELNMAMVDEINELELTMGEPPIRIGDFQFAGTADDVEFKTFDLNSRGTPAL